MTTLSDIVLAQGRSDEADVEWLHLLVGDWQLLADLAFADIVLWVPSADDSFVAVAHARPSSSATLFYRDFVGQEIKPEWAAEAFSDLDEDVRQSIARIKTSPFIPHTDSVRGFVYDVETGKLREVS